MKLIELTFNKAIPVYNFCFIGRKCYLPSDIEWPTNKNGDKLLHILSFTDEIFGKNREMVYSIFIPFGFDGYINSYYSDNHEENSSVILSYYPGNNFRDEFPDESPVSYCTYIGINQAQDEDDSQTTGSKVWGMEAWLQDEIKYPGHSCKFDLYGIDIESNFETQEIIFSDGVSYVFMSDNPNDYKHGGNIGKIFLQLG